MTNITASRRSVNAASSPPSFPKHRLLFATVPQELLLPPAIRRGRQDCDLLLPFEFSVAMAVIGLARKVLGDQRHLEALEAGAAAIKKEQQSEKRYREEWREVRQARQAGRDARAPLRVHTFDIFRERVKPVKYNEALTKAGAHGYAMSRRQQKPIPDLITVSTSRRVLLMAVGLATKGRYFVQLPAALDRLTEPVKGTSRPLLREWYTTKTGGLQLQVSGSWLKPPFQKVPLPMPSRAQTLALFLFLQAVNTSPANERAMRFDDLCRTLGLDPRHHNRQRDLNVAIAAVNAHLRRLPDQMIEQLRVPAEYVPVVDGPYVRFSRRLWRQRSDDDVGGRGYVRPARRQPEPQPRSPINSAASTSPGAARYWLSCNAKPSL